MSCKDDNNCTCSNRAETWEKQDGRWLCQAKECTHHLEGGGCSMGQ